MKEAGVVMEESLFDWDRLSVRQEGGHDERRAAEIRRTWHIGDFRAWKDHDKYKEAFARLMRDLKAEEKSGN
jgi:hypothetical protein